MLVLDQGGRERPRTSAGARELPCLADFAVDFRSVPFWADFTPKTALVFVNNHREKLEVL